ncbi:hypothetical protein B0H13DRAFT_2663025 [Mycena leptocephala]|nr:hypothetical protein B0H13DRAFT_2663025 [Mycena leptocephala]
MSLTGMNPSKHTADNSEFLDGLPARQLIAFRTHIYAPGYLIPNTTQFLDNEWIEISPVLKDFLRRISSDCRVKPQVLSRSHQHFVTCSTKFQGKYRAHIIPDYVDENLLARLLPPVLTANSSEPSRRDHVCMYIIYLGKKLTFICHRIPTHKRVDEEHPCNKKARASKSSS